MFLKNDFTSNPTYSTSGDIVILIPPPGASSRSLHFALFDSGFFSIASFNKHKIVDPFASLSL